MCIIKPNHVADEWKHNQLLCINARPLLKTAISVMLGPVETELCTLITVWNFLAEKKKKKKTADENWRSDSAAYLRFMVTRWFEPHYNCGKHLSKQITRVREENSALWGPHTHARGAMSRSRSHLQTLSEASNRCDHTSTSPASVADPQQIAESETHHSSDEASVILHSHCVFTRLKGKYPTVFMSSELERGCSSDPA